MVESVFFQVAAEFDDQFHERVAAERGYVGSGQNQFVKLRSFFRDFAVTTTTVAENYNFEHHTISLYRA